MAESTGADLPLDRMPAFGRLKGFRPIATRCDRSATDFMADIHTMAIAACWLRVRSRGTEPITADGPHSYECGRLASSISTHRMC